MLVLIIVIVLLCMLIIRPTTPVVEGVIFNVPYMIDHYNKHDIKYDNKSRTLTKNGISKPYLSHFNTRRAVLNCRQKNVTSTILRSANIPVPASYTWRHGWSHNDNITKMLRNMKFPVVVKPANGTQGRGVTVGVRNRVELIKCVSALKKEPVVVEQQVSGENYRILVLNNHIIDIVHRLAPAVIGNGKDSLRTLIDKYNINQRKHSLFPIKNINYNYIKDQGYTINSVIPSGSKVTVTNTVNFHNGSKLARIPQSMVHPSIINASKRINKLIGANCTGIDLMTDDISKPGGHFIEVNAFPDMYIHTKVDNNNKYYAVDRFVKNIFV